ncbi:hypothetical protein SAMN05443248_3354 [Bradyrhizobium erythrophlei]|jgi:hypothetical protein|uniref:Uncharacterized protein n=1 Tax=Bradyrhizobium erythrophlei TaxID=1437360 RepID=A0A1M5PGJ2_9BRAD|nr:hypothetical protein SAMN05443248_3354 [Bradyrhizobium erythrophlei]
MSEDESGGQGLAREARQGLPEANRRGNQLQVKNEALRQCPKVEK